MEYNCRAYSRIKLSLKQLWNIIGDKPISQNWQMYSQAVAQFLINNTHPLQEKIMPQNRNFLMSSNDFSEHIHEHFAWMRQEAPVCKAKLTRFKSVYLITRYHDAQEMLKSPKLVKNPNNARTQSGKTGEIWMPKTFRPLLNNMLNSDEPDHRRLRNLVHKAFTPRFIMQLAPRIEAIANELLDKMGKKSHVELIEGYALPLPVTVIAEMIGIPMQDRAQFLQWTRKIVVNPTPLNMIRAMPAISQFMKYTKKLVEKRQAEPQDDLLTGLVQAENEGERFTEDELLAMVFLLLVAGHETTVGLISNGTLALLDHPDQLELLRSDPTLIEPAIEEMLRYDGPLQTTEMSFARETFTMHGVTIPQGSLVLPAILSANRDETVFENANQLDITRSPNKHLAFGQGIHYCLGAPLARLEAKIAFGAFLERYPTMRLTIPRHQIKYRNIIIMRRLTELPLAL